MVVPRILTNATRPLDDKTTCLWISSSMLPWTTHTPPSETITTCNDSSLSFLAVFDEARFTMDSFDAMRDDAYSAITATTTTTTKSPLPFATLILCAHRKYQERQSLFLDTKRLMISTTFSFSFSFLFLFFFLLFLLLLLLLLFLLFLASFFCFFFLPFFCFFCFFFCFFCFFFFSAFSAFSCFFRIWCERDLGTSRGR